MPAAWLDRREKCAAQVQDAFFPHNAGQGGSWRRKGGPAEAALQRCMHGGPIGYPHPGVP
jgi:hypothetical protein